MYQFNIEKKPFLITKGDINNHGSMHAGSEDQDEVSGCLFSRMG